MLDKSIPYKSIYMQRPAGLSLPPEPQRTDGFFVKLYAPGDEVHWARIEKSVGEFDTESAALDYFAREYAPHPQLLKERMCFMCTPEGLPVATASAWEKDGQNLLHWLACAPEYQKKGLGRAVVTHALYRFPNEDSVLLHTQTWSHDAILLYHSLGFCLLREGEKGNQYAEAMEILQNVYPKETYAALIRAAK